MESELVAINDSMALYYRPGIYGSTRCTCACNDNISRQQEYNTTCRERYNL